MPGSWEDLRQEYQERVFEKNPLGDYRVIEALSLLQEMAEALEIVVEYCPRGCEDDIEADKIYGHKEAREALKKFRDWK
jgi:hypothetical protein